MDAPAIVRSREDRDEPDDQEYHCHAHDLNSGSLPVVPRHDEAPGMDVFLQAAIEACRAGSGIPTAVLSIAA